MGRKYLFLAILFFGCAGPNNSVKNEERIGVSFFTADTFGHEKNTFSLGEPFIIYVSLFNFSENHGSFKLSPYFAPFSIEIYKEDSLVCPKFTSQPFFKNLSTSSQGPPPDNEFFIGVKELNPLNHILTCFRSF